MPQYTYTTSTYITKVLHLFTYYICTAILNNSFSVAMYYPIQHYPVISSWFIQCISNFMPLLRYWLQLPYKSCGPCLTNHMWFIHITPHHTTKCEQILENLATINTQKIIRILSLHSNGPNHKSTKYISEIILATEGNLSRFAPLFN